jgi:hypothetical protein
MEVVITELRVFCSGGLLRANDCHPRLALAVLAQLLETRSNPFHQNNLLARPSFSPDRQPHILNPMPQPLKFRPSSGTALHTEFFE